MGMKSMMIDFHLQRTNQALEVILTFQYINRDGHGMVYTIGRNLPFDEMQLNLMV